MILADNGISRVELREDGYVYKTQPKFMTDSEIWILKLLYPSGYVPFAERVEKEVIRLEYIENEPVTNPDMIMYHFARVLRILEECQIRHGDLTEKNILIKGNKPYLIDFSESRLTCDPRLDKRREGDEYWLRRTFEKLTTDS